VWSLYFANEQQQQQYKQQQGKKLWVAMQQRKLCQQLWGKDYTLNALCSPEAHALLFVRF
jgi:hypothetical protein